MQMIVNVLHCETKDLPGDQGQASPMQLYIYIYNRLLGLMDSATLTDSGRFVEVTGVDIPW